MSVRKGVAHKLLMSTPDDSEATSARPTPSRRRNDRKRNTRKSRKKSSKKWRSSKGKHTDAMRTFSDGRLEAKQKTFKLIRESARSPVSFEATHKTDLKSLQVFSAPTMDSLYSKIENSRRHAHGIQKRKKPKHRIRRMSLLSRKAKLHSVDTTATKRVVVDYSKEEQSRRVKPPIGQRPRVKKPSFEEAPVPRVKPDRPTTMEDLDDFNEDDIPGQEPGIFNNRINVPDIDVPTPPSILDQPPTMGDQPLPPTISDTPLVTPDDTDKEPPPVILDDPPPTESRSVFESYVDKSVQSNATVFQGEEVGDDEELDGVLAPEERIANDYNLKEDEAAQGFLSRMNAERSKRSHAASAVDGEWPDSKEGAIEVIDDDDFEGDEGGDGGSTYMGSNLQMIRSKSKFKIASAFLENATAESLKSRYRREYLSKNVLEVLYQAFHSLDNTINLFFHTYGSLKRSSYQCARIWVYVMKIRMLMMDSMSHLVDEPHFLAPGFQTTRSAQIAVIRDAIRVVAGAVQYVVTFTKHTEEWRFHRRPFLIQLGYDIAQQAKSKADQWLKFEIYLYEMTGLVENSYRAHVELEEVKIIRSLLEVQPKSEKGHNDMRYIDNLDRMVTDLKRVQKASPDGNISTYFENERSKVKGKVAHIIQRDFYHLRVQLSIVKDIYDMHKFEGMLPDDIPDEQDTSVRDRGVALLKEQLKMNDKLHILQEDMNIWPHQSGIAQVGPFKLLSLNDASEYLVCDHETNTYTYLQADNGVEHMDFYVGLVGAFTQPSPVTIKNDKTSKAIRKNLSIPHNAVTYSYFHPLRYNAEHVNSFDPEDLRQLQEGISEMNGVLSPLHAIVGVGGFGYFDKDDQLIRVNGLTMGEDIFFDGPYFLPSNEGFSKAKAAGIEMTVITLKGLEPTGAMNHGWLSSKEQLDHFKRDNREFLASDGEVRGFRGGFFYQYNNSDHPEWDDDENQDGGRRNFFQLIDFTELSFQRAKNRNTLLLSNLEYEISLRKEDWNAAHFESNDSDYEDMLNEVQSDNKICSLM